MLIEGQSLSDTEKVNSDKDLAGHTPMMAQYLAIKADFPDALVF